MHIQVPGSCASWSSCFTQPASVPQLTSAGLLLLMPHGYIHIIIYIYIHIYHNIYIYIPVYIYIYIAISQVCQFNIFLHNITKKRVKSHGNMHADVRYKGSHPSCTLGDAALRASAYQLQPMCKKGHGETPRIIGIN